MVGRLFSVLLIIALLSPASWAVSLEQALQQAVSQDLRLDASIASEQSLRERAKAAAVWQDPTIQAGIMNAPVGDWSLNSQDMTQIQVGISQALPRGESLSITKRQLLAQAQAAPWQREQRIASVKRQVAKTWLDAYLAQRTLAIISQSEEWFTQLQEVTEASYATAVGQTRQQDIVQAELALLQLQDRQFAAQQRYASSQAALLEWLQPVGDVIDVDAEQALPALPVEHPRLLTATPADLLVHISQHPAVQVFDKQWQAQQQGVQLAKEQRKPQWTVSAAYGMRQDNTVGQSRPDLFSIGVGVQVPLFAEHKQQRQVSAAIHEASAIKTEQQLAVRALAAQAQQARQQYHHLVKRQQLYQQKILPQSLAQADTALNAYTHDDGSFAQVIRARISHLQNTLAALEIDIAALNAVADFNYLTSAPPKVQGVPHE